MPLPYKRSLDGTTTDCIGRHLIAAYYSFVDPEKSKGWVFPVGWSTADGLSPYVVTHQLQVECRTGKVRRSNCDVLPLCHATDLRCHERRRVSTVPKVHCVPICSRRRRGTRRTCRRRGSARRSAARWRGRRPSTTSTRSTSSTWTRRRIRSPDFRHHCAAVTTSASPSHVSLTSLSDVPAATACLPNTISK